jgi:hypothetical protein
MRPPKGDVTITMEVSPVPELPIEVRGINLSFLFDWSKFVHTLLPCSGGGGGGLFQVINPYLFQVWVVVFQFLTPEALLACQVSSFHL